MGKIKRGRPSIWHRIVDICLAVANILCTLGLTASAYAGAINPAEHPSAPVVAMTFPVCLAASVVILLLSLIIRWRIGLITVAGMAIALPAILDFMPLHLPKNPTDPDECFTIMSYNVFGLNDQSDSYPGDTNPTLSHIIATQPDIVCLQELSYLSPSGRNHVTQAQIDSIHSLYPYVILSSRAQGIFSKYPVEPVQTGFRYSGKPGAADMACFRVTVKGRQITVFNVHLQSFSLVDEDKQMFSRLTHLKGSEEEMAEMRQHLINKIRTAGPIRVDDTQELLRYVKKFGGPDVIICGDFNDTPGSYPLRLLEKAHFKEVYPEVGLGPMITYNARGFYFRIDHILYRGALQPIAMHRGSIRSSDHYPITATFELNN